MAMIIFRLESLSFVTHPPTLMFQNSMAVVTFATQWKRANIVPRLISK